MSSLSSWDAARIREYEDREPDEIDEIDENEMWLRADDEAEERFCERLMNGRDS